MAREIESADELRRHLAEDGNVAGLRLQDIDLTDDLGRRLLEIPGSLDGLVVLGGQVPDDVVCELLRRHALVFPRDPHAPIDPYRARLYRADELYAGLESGGYPQTPDYLAYEWSQQASTAFDAYASALRALHDDAIRDALHETLAGRSCVGVMGGHAIHRDSATYREVAYLGKQLADHGHLVLTGGGPGAMEAANLGAATRNHSLEDALELLAGTPRFEPSIGAWADAAFRAREIIGSGVKAHDARTIGIPTWFYGHEPPNVFGDAIAKYFSNAVREDDLLAASHRAVIVLEGAAGTVQEIFQAATPMFYARVEEPMPHLILVGTRQWTQTIPVWPALTALADGKPMRERLHLVETPDEAAQLLA